MGSQDRVQRKTKSRQFTRVLTTFVILAGLLVSGYYVFSSTVDGGAYKIYVGGKGYGESQNNVRGNKGFNLNYNSDAETGYSNLVGKGLRSEASSLWGMSFSTESMQDANGKVYSNGFTYLMSVASNHENSVKTNVTDNGKSGEANGDQFLASKFYLRNDRTPDPKNGDDGVIDYAIQLDITANSNNALSAARFALIKVKDEANVFNYDEVTYNNDYFDIMVIGQPRTETLENGDTLIYKGTEEGSEEYVAACVTGDYTNTPDTILFKNPNKGYEEENWKCKNLILRDLEDGGTQWSYDTKTCEKEQVNQVFSLDPGEQVAYVIAAWFEASDPNHNNSIMGGYISFSFTFYEV